MRLALQISSAIFATPGASLDLSLVRDHGAGGERKIHGIFLLIE